MDLLDIKRHTYKNYFNYYIAGGINIAINQPCNLIMTKTFRINNILNYRSKIIRK